VKQNVETQAMIKAITNTVTPDMDNIMMTDGCITGKEKNV
jgi:hypothetical protein